MIFTTILVTLHTTFRRFSSVANFGTNYFLLKIKILAKRERELTTKFAIARNGCWQIGFIFSAPKFTYSFYLIFTFGSDIYLNPLY